MEGAMITNGAYAKHRRDALAAEGNCINGGHHPKPARGTKCDWCRVVHRIGVKQALAMASASLLAPQPPISKRIYR
jgi:hypothetical protein